VFFRVCWVVLAFEAGYMEELFILERSIWILNNRITKDERLFIINI